MQANDAELKEDREILCSEVFTDVTGELDELAQGMFTYHTHLQFCVDLHHCRDIFA